jgi:divalent metal cation (Fe/Co/Zn/Cd) transporter
MMIAYILAIFAGFHLGGPLLGSLLTFLLLWAACDMVKGTTHYDL